MWVRWIGKLVCSALLFAASSASAVTGNREIYSPWTAAPSCPAGKACVYMLASDGQLYVVDGAAATLKISAAKSFRTAVDCTALASFADGDICYDTTLGYFRLYAAGWKTIPTTAASPLSLSGQTLSIAASGLVYAAVSSGASGVLGAATLYLRAPGLAAYGTTETELLVAPRAGTVRNLRCHLGVAPGGADTVINTVRVNAVDSITTCTISAANTTCADTTNTAAVAAGNRLSVMSVSSAGTASDIACSFEVTN
ncbi:hypothetical protein K0U83_12055 [bacterium]|nr:hypothetical protein [bacterium]